MVIYCKWQWQAGNIFIEDSRFSWIYIHDNQDFFFQFGRSKYWLGGVSLSQFNITSGNFEMYQAF